MPLCFVEKQLSYFYTSVLCLLLITGLWAWKGGDNWIDGCYSTSWEKEIVKRWCSPRSCCIFRGALPTRGRIWLGQWRPAVTEIGFGTHLGIQAGQKGQLFVHGFFWSLGNVTVESTFSSSVQGLRRDPPLYFWVCISIEGQSQQSSHFAREGMIYSERKSFICCSGYNVCYDPHTSDKSCDKLSVFNSND